MDFRHLVTSRYSCRNYQKRNVSDELLNSLFETCHFAPSAANFQPWEFIVINNPALLEKVYGSYSKSWIKTAPVVLVAIADKKNAWVRTDGKNHSDIDLAIFIDHLTLAATEKELATCWICNFDVKTIKQAFSIPEDKEPVALISLGYPVKGHKAEKKRKQTSEFIYFNSYLHD